jgi:heme exporter protein B
VILAPFFFVFYNLHIAGQAWLLALVLPLGTWALVANGIFFAALSIRSRNRELLLSLILFPIFIPALLAMVQATTAILTGESDPTLWIKMLVGYDIIFTTVSLLLFDVVFHAEYFRGIHPKLPCFPGNWTCFLVFPGFVRGKPSKISAWRICDCSVFGVSL